MNTKEMLAHRRTTGEVSRMTIPVDADTTRRLAAVIAMRLDDEGVLRHQTEAGEVDSDAEK